jgi:hypothetical protein
MTRDGFGFRSIPVFTGALAFLPACGGDDANVTGADDTGGTTSATDDSTGTPPTSSVDDSTSNGESTSAESAETGDPLCGGAGSCGAMPPVGWFGPVVYARVVPGQEMPTCPAEVPEVGPILADGFADPGPTLCGCECQLTQPASCYSSIIGQGGGYNDEGYYGSGGFIIYPDTDGYYGSGGYMSGGYVTGYVGTGYGGGSGYGVTGNYGSDGYADSGYGGGCYGGYDYIGDGCLNIEIDGAIRFSSYDDYYGGGGMCEETATELIPAFAWAATIATCRLPDTALLCGDDGVCIPPAPDGFEAQWCMYQEGDLECPAGPYPNKVVFWSDVEDTRDCSNCACGSTGSSCEDAQLLVYSEPDCAGVPIATIPADNQCVEVVAASVAADFGAEAACPVTDESVAEGAIAPTGPFTFCCSD